MDIPYSSNASQIEQIREEIELHGALLESLDNALVPDVEARQVEITRTLESLERQLRDLESESLTQRYQSLDGMDNDHRHASASIHGPSLDIPGRKRHQNHLDVEFPEAKSRRQSPSGALTPASSVGSGSSSSIEFLGVSPLQPVEAPASSSLRRVHDPMKQLNDDADIARKLQADLDRENRSKFNSSQRTFPGNSYTQSFFRSDGTINRSQPRPANQSSSSAAKPSWANGPEASGESRLKTENPWGPRVNDESAPSTPFPQMTSNSLSSPQTLQSTAVKNKFPPSEPLGMQTQMQGYPYGRSTGGTGYVYNPYAGASHSNDMLGTRLNPFDLDSYPFPDNDLPHRFYETFATPAETEEHIKNLLKQIRPDEELTEEERSQIPEGLRISLMKHQAAGVAWMKRMEESPSRGGILADDMGLGKTVQTIALMLARPPPPNSRQPTLIVAPLALLRQWNEELTKFVLPSHRFNVLILHGPNRPTKWSAIKAYDVVITTYSTLATELKRKLVFLEKRKFNHLATPTGREEFPLLGDQTLFHRVVLDEAQNIKNKGTKSAMAACSLNATHRWCLTGTPMQNNTDEMFSLIKFCRIPPYNDHERFRRDISQPLRSANIRESARDRAMERLQALLKSIMLRRNKKSKVDGKPILQLPPKRSVEDRAHFDKDQLDFYRALETRAQIQFNKYVQAGSVGRNYSNALVLLLRLRQACCHPHLITNAGDFAVAVTDLNSANFKKNAKALTWSVITRLKADLEVSEAVECPVCMDANDNPIIFACGHALCNDCLARLTDNALNDNGEGSKPVCPHCLATIDATKITNLISFLRVHWPDHEKVKDLKEEDHEAGVDVNDSDDDSDSDDSSDDDDEADGNGDLRDFVVADDADIEYGTDNTESKQKPEQSRSRSRSRSQHRSKKGKDKARDKLPQLKGKSLGELRREALKSKSAKKKYLKKLTKNYVPSAKIEKTLALLEEIRAAGQGEKTIIFSSFTSFLDLIEVPLSAHPDFRVYVRYDGSMKRQDREEAVYRFREDRDCKVMLVSLKAGNAGLNLTSANHVIILDPFWNPFVEYQAADRCYRIGQTKPVTIHRILIGEQGREYRQVAANDEPVKADDHEDAGEDAGVGPAALEEDVEDINEDNFTVEDRIIKLQEKKKRLVEMALDERAGERIGRLGQRELGYLFGVNRLD